MWDVLDTLGNHLAIAATQAGVGIWSIDGDRVLASMTDSVGVEYIAVFRVVR
jgi:hypothetical protein